jgi:hypothetical protein
MRKKTPPGVTFDVPHEALLASFKTANAGWLDLAERLERGDALTQFERETIAIGLRLYVASRKPPAHPRGAAPKFDAGEAALNYGRLVNAGKKPSDAIGQIADSLCVSEESVRKAIAPMREQAVYLARVLPQP